MQKIQLKISYNCYGTCGKEIKAHLEVLPLMDN